ncbi:MAG: sulfite exporter TauE/SafE family protein [Pirellulales bacterium]|nr:sulfite exporter TauE/SafE family protein [Pirellulales bacterium]
MELEIWQLVMLFVVGCAAGFMNVLAGGGSLMTMPLMVFIGIQGPFANGTNRVAIFAQNVSAVVSFFRQGFSDFKLSLSLLACALPGTLVGAWLGTNLRGRAFNWTLAVVIITVLILMLWPKRGKKKQDEILAEDTLIQLPDEDEDTVETFVPSRWRVVVTHFLMLLAGFYGGIIQAGVGFVFMAILHRVLGLDLVRVNMHKVFIIGGYTIIALSVFAWQGYVYWTAGICLAVGNSLGAWVGARFAVKRGEKAIRVVFTVAIFLMALRLMFM